MRCPRVILFDAPGDKSIVAENLGMSYFNMQFLERLKVRLAGRYEEGATTNGWQIWQLRLPEQIPAR